MKQLLSINDFYPINYNKCWNMKYLTFYRNKSKRDNNKKRKQCLVLKGKKYKK